MSTFKGKTQFLTDDGTGNAFARDYNLYGVGKPFGNTFFVNSVIGSNTKSGYGFSPTTPFASLDFALGKTTPDNDDTIFLLPGHVETISAAGTSKGNGGVFCGPTLSNGVTIQGIGSGRNRPQFNYTTAVGASFNVSALNVTIKNCVFTINFDAITAAMNVTGADFWMDGCEWAICSTDAASQMVLGILTAATATRFKVTNTRFLGPATVTGTTCTACIKHEVGIDYVIEGCEFMGKMTQAILNATAILGGRIGRNNFHIYTGTKGLALHAQSTPHVHDNNFVVASGTAPVVGTIASWVNNHYTTEGIGLTAGNALTF